MEQTIYKCMEVKKNSKLFQDSSGNWSSGRLFQLILILWFVIFNYIAIVNVFDNDKSVLDFNALAFVLTHDVLVLIAIFVPKQLAKVSESKEFLSLMDKIKDNKSTT
jgi:hypothetical protein